MVFWTKTEQIYQEDSLQKFGGQEIILTFVSSWIMTTFGNKIQVSDPTDACFLFLNGIPTEEMYYQDTPKRFVHFQKYNP